MLATKARAGLPGEARAGLAALDEEDTRSGEARNADAVICLAEGEPAAALSVVASVLDGTAPVLGYTTVMEAHLLAGLAHRQLGDQHAANRAAEHALALAEQDRVVLPFVMTGSTELLEALPRHETAHAALLADILDLLHGSSLAAKDNHAPPLSEKLSPGEIRVLRYLPTNLSRSEIAASCPSRRTRSARTSAASTPSSASPIAPRRSDVPASYGSSQPSAVSTTFAGSQPPAIGSSRRGPGLSFGLVHSHPPPFTAGYPDRVRPSHGRWRTPVNAGQHYWKACWATPQEFESPILRHLSPGNTPGRSCVRLRLARLSASGPKIRP